MTEVLSSSELIIDSLSYSAHGAGLVSLEVACQGRIISQSVIFEYKEQSAHRSHSSKSKDNANTLLRENYLRTQLLQKLEALDICMGQDKDIFLEPQLGTSEVGRI